MRLAIIALFIGFSSLLSAQTKTLSFTDASFRGQMKMEDGSIRTYQETWLSEALNIHQWVIEYDTATGHVGIYGFDLDDDEGFYWEELFQCTQKWSTKDQDTKTFTMEDPTTGAGFTIAWKWQWVKSKKGKYYKKWYVSWLASHSLDYPNYSTRLLWQTETQPKTTLAAKR